MKRLSLVDAARRGRHAAPTDAPDPPPIFPRDYPELALRAWNRDPTRPIPPDQALALFERNWRHLDPARFTPRETALIRALADRHGRGHLLV